MQNATQAELAAAYRARLTGRLDEIGAMLADPATPPAGRQRLNAGLGIIWRHLDAAVAADGDLDLEALRRDLDAITAPATT